MKRTHKEAGVTLVELIIAASILSGISANSIRVTMAT